MSDLDSIQEITINCDSRSAVDTANNGIVNRKTRHYRVRVHAIHEDIENHEIKVSWIPTKSQVADFLTKALPRESFKNCLTGAGIL